MKILIVSDAWHPQINGVVRSIDNTAKQLRQAGDDVVILSPMLFKTFPMPFYPEIRLALLMPGILGRRKIGRLIESIRPDSIHIATEGPLGMAVRAYLVHKKKAFTTSFHTKFPEYLHARCGIPLKWSYGFLRRFHTRAHKTFVTTKTQKLELDRREITNTIVWPRGVDISLFTLEGPSSERLDTAWPRPWLLNVGRIAVEKNLEAFLELKTPGTKILVGSGPAQRQLQRRYKDVKFIGSLNGEALAAAYRSCDIMVFPSRTDTFGLVIIEALASGLPVAAYPVTGPIDILDEKSGAMAEDLKMAIENALKLEPAYAANYARNFSWQKCTEIFRSNLCTLEGATLS